jgi:hypothetical protein
MVVSKTARAKAKKKQDSRHQIRNRSEVKRTADRK